LHTFHVGGHPEEVLKLQEKNTKLQNERLNC